MSLLKSSGRVAKRKDNDPELRRTAATLQTTLSDFGIDASVVGWIAGPTVTLFEVDLPDSSSRRCPRQSDHSFKR